MYHRMMPFVLLSVQSGLLLTSAWKCQVSSLLTQREDIQYLSLYIVQSYTGEYYDFVAEFVYM